MSETYTQTRFVSTEHTEPNDNMGAGDGSYSQKLAYSELSNGYERVESDLSDEERLARAETYDDAIKIYQKIMGSKALQLEINRENATLKEQQVAAHIPEEALTYLERISQQGLPLTPEQQADLAGKIDTELSAIKLGIEKKILEPSLATLERAAQATGALQEIASEDEVLASTDVVEVIVDKLEETTTKEGKVTKIPPTLIRVARFALNEVRDELQEDGVAEDFSKLFNVNAATAMMREAGKAFEQKDEDEKAKIISSSDKPLSDEQIKQELIDRDFENDAQRIAYAQAAREYRQQIKNATKTAA